MRIPAVVTVGMLMRRKMDLNYPRRLKSIKGLRRVKEGGRERQRQRQRQTEIETERFSINFLQNLQRQIKNSLKNSF